MTASQKQHTRKAFTEDPQRPLTCRVCSRPWHWCPGACDCALLLRTFAVHPPTVLPPGANLPSGQLGNRGQLSSVNSPRNLAPISHHRWLLCSGWASTDRKAYESESHRLSPHNSTAHADKTGRPGTPPLLGSLSTGRARQGPRSISEEFFWILASDTVFVSICQTQPIFTNTETAMLSKHVTL